MNSPWFKPRRFGFGIRPASPAGWALTGAMLLCLLAVHQLVLPKSETNAVIVTAAVLVCFLTLAFAKTERRG